MKRIKTLFAILLAVMMVLPLGGTMALAATGDTTISVTGLDNRDKVTYYSVVKWVDSTGWVLDEGFTSLDLADILDGITQNEANTIAALAAGATPKGTNMSVSNGEWKVTNPNPGLYMVLVTAGEPGYMYNPIFVSADFKTDNTNNTIAGNTATYSDTSLAKKQKVTVEKTEASLNYDHNVGDEVNFVVQTTIPVFLGSYTNPRFEIADAVSQGLEITPNSVKVEYGTKSLTSTGAGTTENADLTMTVSNSSISVAFKPDYLKANTVAVNVKLTYKATVTSEAKFNVNEETNEVVVTFSNGPGTDVGVVKDETTHYTFSLTADIWGESTSTDKTSIIRKVGVDPNGEIIIETVDGGTTTSTKTSPLDGAVFKLYTDSACTQLYTNDIFNGTVTSTNGGFISIKGLDAGTYYLKEETAPEGYIKDDAVHTITISPTYQDKEFTETVNEIEVKYTCKVLVSYTVSFDGTVMSTYTFTNTSPVIENSTIISEPSYIINTPGTELPTTGGIGTTIFYIVGSMLVIGAIIMIVTRRKMNSGK